MADIQWRDSPEFGPECRLPIQGAPRRPARSAKVGERASRSASEVPGAESHGRTRHAALGTHPSGLIRPRRGGDGFPCAESDERNNATGKLIQETRAADAASGADCFEWFGSVAAAISGNVIELGGPFAYTRPPVLPAPQPGAGATQSSRPGQRSTRSRNSGSTRDAEAVASAASGPGVSLNASRDRSVMRIGYTIPSR